MFTRPRAGPTRWLQVSGVPAADAAVRSPEASEPPAARPRGRVAPHPGTHQQATARRQLRSDVDARLLPLPPGDIPQSGIRRVRPAPRGTELPRRLLLVHAEWLEGGLHRRTRREAVLPRP